MVKVIRCRKCGNLLAEVLVVTANFIDLKLKIDKLRIADPSILVCGCGEGTNVTEDNMKVE